MLVAERITFEKMENTKECLGCLNGVNAHDPHDNGSVYGQMDGVLYQNLHTIVKTTEGEPFVTAHQNDRSGFNLWSEMAQHFDPSAVEDRSIEHARVTRPEGWLGNAKSTADARLHLERWQTERRRYEAKWNTKVEKMDLLVALKSMMPGTMFGENGCFRGQKNIGFVEFLKKVVAYVDDKPMPLNVALAARRKANIGSMEDEDKEKRRRG